MNTEVWQQLLSLESRDIVKKWFKKIHDNELNAKRTKEINYAAKQAREFFKNASNSDYSVRPLLTYYGVASLTRSLILLLNKRGGEETLTRGHGLETTEWSENLSKNGQISHISFLDLKVNTCAGLFKDLIRITENRMSMHVRSSAVDWTFYYEVSDRDIQLSFRDLIKRIPDLQKDFSQVESSFLYCNINQMTFSQEDGINIKVKNDAFDPFKQHYVDLGYCIEPNGDYSEIKYKGEDFQEKKPMFIHSYIQKTFGTIPVLNLTKPFDNNYYISQIGITYMLSFYLGMLVRYFPTQWISLIQGDNGDMLWPTLNRTQHLIENSYPELVIEMIHDILQ